MKSNEEQFLLDKESSHNNGEPEKERNVVCWSKEMKRKELFPFLNIWCIKVFKCTKHTDNILPENLQFFTQKVI